MFWTPQVEALLDYKCPIHRCIHREAEHFLKHVATSRTAKCDKLCAYFRARLLFALVRGTSMYLRGFIWKEGTRRRGIFKRPLVNRHKGLPWLVMGDLGGMCIERGLH